MPRMTGDAFDMLMDHWRDSSILPQTSTALPKTMRQALLDRFVARLQSGAFPHSGPLGGLRNCLSEPLPVEVAERLLASPTWRNYLAALAEKQISQQKTDTESLMHTAMLLPAACMPAFLAAIEPLPPAINRKARDFAHFVLALPDPAPASDER